MSSYDGFAMTITLMAVFLSYFAAVLAGIEARKRDWWAFARCLIFAFFASSMLAGRISWILTHYAAVTP